jgi:hypothetical protein
MCSVTYPRLQSGNVRRGCRRVKAVSDEDFAAAVDGVISLGRDGTELGRDAARRRAAGAAG